MEDDEIAAAIGLLEVTKAKLYARLTANGRQEAPPTTRNETAPDKLLTVNGAAGVLGVTRRWLYDHADQLPFTRRIGARTLRFSERGLNRYMATRR